MSSSIASTLVIISTLSILLLFSTSNANSSSTLIERVCSSTRNDFNLKSCVKVLQSEPRVASTTNLFDLSVGIIKSGISRATRTSRHVNSTLNKSSTNPNLKGALQDCKLAYDWIIGSFKSALGEVKEKEYQTATYDLLIGGTDNVIYCEKAVASEGIKDEIILRGNKLAKIFGLSAFEAVCSLELQ